MKQLSGFILFILLGVACQPIVKGSQNEETVRGMFDAFNRHDWKSMAAYYSEPAQFLDPSFGTEYVSKTREETAGKYAEMQKMFPDIHDEIVGLYSSGDKVTVEFVSTATAPDSTIFKLPIVTVLTVKDGLIVRDATYYDNP